MGFKGYFTQWHLPRVTLLITLSPMCWPHPQASSRIVAIFLGLKRRKKITLGSSPRTGKLPEIPSKLSLHPTDPNDSHNRS